MNKRGFLKSIVGGLAAVALVPSVISAKPALKEITLKVRPDALARNRKLKAVWSYESQQDLRAWHNLESEKELQLAEEISELPRPL